MVAIMNVTVMVIMIVTVMVIYDCHGNGHNDCQDDGY